MQYESDKIPVRLAGRSEKQPLRACLPPTTSPDATPEVAVQSNSRTEFLSARVNVENWAAGQEVLDSWIPADPSRPVYSAIRSAFIEQFSLLYLLLSCRTANSSTDAAASE